MRIPVTVFALYPHFWEEGHSGEILKRMPGTTSHFPSDLCLSSRQVETSISFEGTTGCVVPNMDLTKVTNDTSSSKSQRNLHLPQELGRNTLHSPRQAGLAIPGALTFSPLSPQPTPGAVPYRQTCRHSPPASYNAGRQSCGTDGGSHPLGPGQERRVTCWAGQTHLNSFGSGQRAAADTY